MADAPEGLKRLDMLSLDAKDRATIRNGLERVRIDTTRAQRRCMELRENAHKYGTARGADADHWKRQWEAYQRGLDRVRRLTALFQDQT